MIGMHFNKDIICRTCVKSDVELTSLYGKLDTFDEICYSELITEFTMYSVQEDDELPQNICWECINEAKIAYNFKKKCQESHRKLLALIDPTKNVPDHPTDSIYFGMSDHLETQIPNTIVPMMGNESTASTSTQIMPRRQKDNTLSNQSLICPMCCIEFVTMEFLTRHLNDFHKNAEPIDEKPVFEITIKSEPDDAPMVKLESELDSLSEQVGLEEPPMDIKIEIEENPTHVPDPIPETNNSFKENKIMSQEFYPFNDTRTSFAHTMTPFITTLNAVLKREEQNFFQVGRAVNDMSDRKYSRHTASKKDKTAAAAYMREYRARKKGFKNSNEEKSFRLSLSDNRKNKPCAADYMREYRARKKGFKNSNEEKCFRLALAENTKNKPSAADYMREYRARKKIKDSPNEKQYLRRGQYIRAVPVPVSVEEIRRKRIANAAYMREYRARKKLSSEVKGEQ